MTATKAWSVNNTTMGMPKAKNQRQKQGEHRGQQREMNVSRVSRVTIGTMKTTTTKDTNKDQMKATMTMAMMMSIEGEEGDNCNNGHDGKRR